MVFMPEKLQMVASTRPHTVGVRIISLGKEKPELELLGL